MEYGDFLTAASQAFKDHGLVLLLGVISLMLILALWLYQRQNAQQRLLQRELRTLRSELNEQRLQPGGSGLSSDSGLSSSSGRSIGSGLPASSELSAGSGLSTGSGLSAGSEHHSRSGLSAGSERSTGSGRPTGAGPSTSSRLPTNSGPSSSSGLSAGPDRGPTAAVAAHPKRPVHSPFSKMQAHLELQAYQKIWPSVRDLHDKLGTFLRTIDSGENPTPSRTAARAAALKAKDCAQRLRPFYPENIEAQVFQLIDNEVHMHLSACAYLDAQERSQTENGQTENSQTEKSTADSNSAYQSLRDESKLIYDGECRQQLNTLVQSIRHRLSGQQDVE